MLFVPILVVGFAASLGLTPLSRALAMRFGIVDQPNQRKIHGDHKPMMGGLAIYIAFAMTLLLFSPAQHFVELGAVLSGAAFLAIIGLWDDRYGLSIRTRLVAMAFAAIVLIVAGIHIKLFRIAPLDYALTILWILTITNAVNFLDNMDGLAAGLTSIAAGFFLILAITQELSLVSSLAAALLGSAVGFLIYNFNPASSFMGDMGALVLGFVLAVLGIKLEFSQPLSVTWMIPVLVLALPIFDIHLVVFTRLIEGRSPGQGGKDHTSHRLMSVGFSQRQTLFILYGACGLFGLIALILSETPAHLAMRLGIASLVLLGLLFIVMMWIRRRYQVA